MAELQRRTFYGKIIGKEYWYIPKAAWKLILVQTLYGIAVIINLLAFVVRPTNGFINLFFAAIMTFFFMTHLKQVNEIRSRSRIISRYTLVQDSVNDQGVVAYLVRWKDGTTSWIPARSGLRQRFSFQESLCEQKQVEE